LEEAAPPQSCDFEELSRNWKLIEIYHPTNFEGVRGAGPGFFVSHSISVHLFQSSFHGERQGFDSRWARQRKQCTGPDMWVTKRT
jgi:hypothetical protein